MYRDDHDRVRLQFKIKGQDLNWTPTGGFLYQQPLKKQIFFTKTLPRFIDVTKLKQTTEFYEG